MTTSRITFQLNEVVSILNAAADRLLRSHFGLTYSQFLFLVTVQGLNKPTPSQVAECLGVSRAAVSQRLESFRVKKLVEVTKVEGNDRNLALSLTEHGASLAVTSADFLEREFRQLLEPISTVNLDHLQSTLTQIKDQLLQARETRNAA